MKIIACGMLMLALAAPAAWASLNVEEDPSADKALLTWTDPSAWQVGLTYLHLSRSVDLEGAERDLSGDGVDVGIGFSPWSWLLLYGQAGAAKASLEKVMREESSSTGAGGLLGARLNLWQIYEGVHKTSWRVTLQLAGQYAYRTTDDGGDGELQWSETMVLLPLDYHLTFARSFRNVYAGEFQSLDFFAGPAFSKLDGTWTRGETERDFEEVQSFGAVAGANLWLLENLAFGARADWFERTSLLLSVLYRF